MVTYVDVSEFFILLAAYSPFWSKTITWINTLAET